MHLTSASMDVLHGKWSAYRCTSCRDPDSNWGPVGYEPTALPHCAIPDRGQVAAALQRYGHPNTLLLPVDRCHALHEKVYYFLLALVYASFAFLTRAKSASVALPAF